MFPTSVSSISMITDTTVDRYYYIFDSRKRRAVVMDRVTGASCVRKPVARARLAAYVRDRRSAGVLRRFARWCAQQVGAEDAPSHTAAGRLWAAARQDDASAWRRARHDTTDAVAVAVTLGLGGAEAQAARLLVLQACTHPDSEDAALDAAHMSERWVEFTAESDPAAAVRSMRAQQVDWLLDALDPA